MRPIPAAPPRASKYSLYSGQKVAPGVKMLNESTPPDKLMYTMALYGEDDFGGVGEMDLGDPVLRTD
jgi:hypothetical protein